MNSFRLKEIVITVKGFFTQNILSNNLTQVFTNVHFRFCSCIFHSLLKHFSSKLIDMNQWRTKFNNHWIKILLNLKCCTSCMKFWFHIWLWPSLLHLLSNVNAYIIKHIKEDNISFIYLIYLHTCHLDQRENNQRELTTFYLWFRILQVTGTITMTGLSQPWANTPKNIFYCTSMIFLISLSIFKTFLTSRKIYIKSLVIQVTNRNNKQILVPQYKYSQI